MSEIVMTPRITLAGAERALAAARTEAGRLGVAVVIVVTDPAGEPLTMVRMDGAPLFSITVAHKKAWTAAAAHTRTCELRTAFNDDPTLLHGLAPKVDRLMAVGGGAPIVRFGATAGAVAVSGASEDQDQQIADAGAAAPG